MQACIRRTYATSLMENYLCKKQLAIEALERLGLKKKSIIIALKDLLKKCNGEWTHIEDDNYRLLVDFYFEMENDIAKKLFRERSKCKEKASILQRQAGDSKVEPIETGIKTLSVEKSAPGNTSALALKDYDGNVQPDVAQSGHRAKHIKKLKTTISASNSSSSSSCDRSMGSEMLLDDNKNLDSERRSCLRHTGENNLQAGVQSLALVRSDRPHSVSKLSSKLSSEMFDGTDCVQKSKKKRFNTEGVDENQRKHDHLADRIKKSKHQHAATKVLCRENPQKTVHLGKEQEPAQLLGSSMKDATHIFKRPSDNVSNPMFAHRKLSKPTESMCVIAGEAPKRPQEARYLKDKSVLASSMAISDGVALKDRNNSALPSSGVCIPITEDNARRRNCEESRPDGANSLVSKKAIKHDPLDISRGEESMPISYVNDSTSEAIPHFFHYIPRNLIYQNAHINFSIARIGEDDCCSCVGSCLTALIPCACTRETGGEYAYTSDGCLQEWFLSESMKDKVNDASNTDRYKSYCKDYVCHIIIIKEGEIPEPCRGHYPRKFVKECCSKCGCWRTCGNRVVQRGICRKLQVFWTPEGKGWGLRTLEDLPKGAFVCEYVGEIMTNYELYARNQTYLKNAKHTYPVLLDADLCSEQHLADEALCLDATFFGNVARFINHRCYDANMLDIPVSFDTADRHYYHHAFFTTKTVKAMEELTWDYSIDFEDEGHPVSCFQCLCGSEYCRGKGAAA